jgi:hypothetical protein
MTQDERDIKSLKLMQWAFWGGILCIVYDLIILIFTAEDSVLAAIIIQAFQVGIAYWFVTTWKKEIKEDAKPNRHR